MSGSAIPNLTRDDASARAGLLHVESYDVALDLTDGGGKPSERPFRSTTTIRLTAASSASLRALIEASSFLIAEHPATNKTAMRSIKRFMAYQLIDRHGSSNQRASTSRAARCSF